MPPYPDDLDLDTRYAAARDIALAAAALGMDYYRRRDSLTVVHKGGDMQDLVSVADRAVEDYIRQELGRRFPEDGLLGEEGGPQDLGARCLWVIDPIDGTTCFLNGLHNWCVSIGLMVDGRPWLGAIADPNHGELFHGCRGRGAFCNDTPLRVSAATHVSQGVTAVGTNHRLDSGPFLTFLQGLLAESGMFLRTGSGALMTAYVAAGRLIGYHETHFKSWDCTAALVLVEEAGGLANDFFRDDGLLRGNPFLVAAPGVYRQLEALIGPTLHQPIPG